MATEEEITDRMNKALIADFNSAPLDRQDYLQVHVLLIFWEDNDLRGIELEVKRLEKLFKSEFNFRTSQYQIPNEHPQLMLQKRLTDFVIDASKEGSLVLVYYGGHGDHVDGRSIWAAKETPDSPSLHWSQVQSTIFSGKGDVLLILDCCHAAAAMRGASFSSMRKVEIVAASGLHRLTPAPGRKSFTAHLTDILKDVFDKTNKRKEIAAAQMVRKIMDLPDTKIKETVYHVSLTSTAETNNTGIILKKYSPPDPEGFGKRPVGTLMIRATLTSDPTGLEIANWLKRSIPSSVASIDIEGLFNHARQLQTGLKNNNGELAEGNVLSNLSTPAKNEILTALEPLDKSISTLDKNMKSNTKLSATDAIRTATKLKSALDNAEREIEAAVILEGGLQDAQKEDMLKMSDTDRFMIDPAAVQLQDIIEKGTDTALAVPREQLKYLIGERVKDHRMRLATLTRGGEKLTVIIEYATFEEDSPTRQKQFRTVAKRLSVRPRKSAHLTLEGLGYLDEPNLSRSGLIFNLPPAFAPRLPISLYDLYKERPIVPLEDRLKLAYNLALSLDNLHIVGWLHKGLDPSNIFFFYPSDYPSDLDDASQLDLSTLTPYLFGFEYSRHETAESSLAADFSVSANIFRHPQRWGKPTVKFTKHHDIYSLGILIFEIALWNRVDAVVMKWEKQRVRVNEKSVLNYVGKKCREEIPHWVGRKVAGAIESCLRFGEEMEGRTEVERRIHFRREVVDKLRI